MPAEQPSQPDKDPGDSPPPTRSAPQPHSGNERKFSSGDLFGGTREIQITHDGEIYRLRVTRSGKLILTK